jgi:menaquinone-specific isochorismate synthase
MDKIVLARRVDLEFEMNLDPVMLLLRLRQVTPQCYNFCFQPGNDGAFIGASPERLYFRHGRWIESEAVAGTRPRGNTPDVDAGLSEALLTSDKDLREHAFVRDMIQESLNPLCRDVAVDGRVSLLKLSRRQHLYSGMSGHLSEAVSDAELCRELHPTPAVGGCPTEVAIDRIREWEGFDRGWYAAPFGVIGRDVVELAVAIRSARVDAKRLSLFSGAGIVSGSTPDQEWDEIENKIVDFIRILTDPA